jgi:hypothetical protein
MPAPRFAPALALFAVVTFATPLRAEVSTTLQFFGPLGPDLTFTEDDPRIVSDSQTRDDATARATAAASADLGTGELAAEATGQLFVPSETGIAARAVASAVDTLTVIGPGTDPVPVSFEMTVDGDLILPETASGSGSAFATVQAVLGIVGSSETATLQWRRQYDASGDISLDNLTGLGDWLGEVPVSGTTNSFELLLRFDGEAVPGVPFDFESELRALVGTGSAIGADAISDFGNTGTFTIILPQDYSFSSESGLFLAGPIPEPGTAILLACGLGGLARVRRGRACAQLVS